jgi:hypothetical protein
MRGVAYLYTDPVVWALLFGWGWFAVWCWRLAMRESDREIRRAKEKKEAAR